MVIISVAIVGVILVIVGAQSLMSGESPSENEEKAMISDVAVNAESMGSNDNNSSSDSANKAAEEESKVIAISPLTAYENIEEICRFHAIGTDDGLELCVKACIPGVCCYTDALPALTSFDVLTHPQEGKLIPLVQQKQNDCSTQYSDMCTEYESCKNLFYLGGSEELEEFGAWEKENELLEVPDPPDNLDILCREDMPSISECSSACKPGHCCRVVTTNESCNEMFPEVCAKYGACNILDVMEPKTLDDDTFTQPSQLDDDKYIETSESTTVADVCTLDRVSTTTGFIECRSVCSVATCCLQPEINCLDVNINDFCLQYEPCTILELYEMALKQLENMEQTTTISTNQSLSSSFEQIETNEAMEDLSNNP